MADQVTARNESTIRIPAPEGQFQAVCVDVIDLGERVERYQDNPPRVVPKVVLVWQIAEDNPDTGKPWEISREFTNSFGQRAGLREFLGNWRGRTYTDEEAAQGVPLHKLEGVNGLLSVEHKKSSAGNVYARAKVMTPILKNMPKHAARDYERAPYWTERKAEYAKEVAAFRAAQNPTEPVAVGSGPLAPDDDSLPF